MEVTALRLTIRRNIRLILIQWLWLVGVLGLVEVPLLPFLQPAHVVSAQPSLAPPSIHHAAPIRASQQSRAGNVTLFRGQATLTQPATAVRLEIFADTRYEVWLNGVWVGRGPARFSRQRQEYDTYTLADLPAGTHTLAVLVHDNPNLRRSEAIQTGLQAALIGTVQGGTQAQALLLTSNRWRAWISPAWNPDARDVHGWGLLGKQELLDLRRLPPDWNQPAFADAGLPFAFAMPATTYPQLHPRSIPLLAHVPRPPVAVVSSGLLSPEQQLLDLDYTTPQLPIKFSTSAPISLPITAINTPTLLLNDVPITATWQSRNDPRRPDVYTLAVRVPAGDHRLSVAVPPLGTAIGLPVTLTTNYTPHLSHDAGRLMQIGEPVDQAAGGPRVTLANGRAQISIPAHPEPRANPAPRFVVLDFGRSIHARLNVVAHGTAGTIIAAGWDERLVGGHPLPAPGILHKNVWSHADAWVLDDQPRPLTTLDTRTGRYLLLVIQGNAPVTLTDLHAREETLVQQVVGQFASDDARLNRIWQVGVDTLIPNMTDAYADPWRERGQWWGDAYAAHHVNRVSVGDLTLWRRGLRQMADDPRPDGIMPPFAPRHGEPTVLLDYSMLWLESLYRYWQLTGDTALVRELYPAAERQIQALRQFENPHGLLDLPIGSQPIVALSAAPVLRAPHLDEPELARWALIDWSGFLSIIGESTPLNALYAANLRWMSEMANATGRNGLAYTQRSTAVQQAINARLWRAEGGYAATRFEGTLFPPTPQAQAWALRYGVVPPARQAIATDVLLDEMTPFIRDDYGFRFTVVEIYGFVWLLDALGQQGRSDAALDLIRTHYGGLLDQGATTWWETFGSLAVQDSALSHGWGGAPTWYLSRYVLGIQIDTPQQWQVAPQPSSLRWANGRVPLVNGNQISVEWAQPACGVFTMQVQAPADQPGTLVVPLTPNLQSRSTITLNGQVVWSPDVQASFATATPHGIALAVQGASSYRITRASPCRAVWLPLVVRE